MLMKATSYLILLFVAMIFIGCAFDTLIKYINNIELMGKVLDQEFDKPISNAVVQVQC